MTKAITAADNPHLEHVPTFTIGRHAVHDRILESAEEGTVWRRLDRPYEPGLRVRHWLKRKREITVEVFVTGSKPGTRGRGNERLIGAVEFGVRDTDGSVRPVAWVSDWSDADRQAMTIPDRTGTPRLDPAYLGQRALISGQGEAARSGRLRHARLHGWPD